VETKEKIRNLVRQAVEAYIMEQQKARQSIAILLTYPTLHPAVVLKAVTPIIENNNVTLFLTKEWQSEFSRKSYFVINEMSKQEIKEMAEKTSILVVPVASYSFLSKLALTIDDVLPVWLAIQYQLEGKPVIIANHHIELNVYQQIHAPHSVQDRIQAYIRQLQADKVKWVPLETLEKTVEEVWKSYKEKKSLILVKHVETVFRDGSKEIVVPKNSQMTPAAKDLARELKIHIRKL
jgi:hypothetical protein